MRRRRIKGMTPEQEADYSRAEILFTRARIIERGVAVFLNTGEYANSNELAEASGMLAESIGYRRKADAIRDEVRKAEREADPQPPKVHTRRRAPRAVR